MPSGISSLIKSSPISGILTKDGYTKYHPEFFSPTESEQYFQKLLESISWQPEELILFGKKITTSRKVAWVGDPNCSYTYSGVKKYPNPWIPELIEIKNKVEELTKIKFNSCLLNLYHNGNEGMGWHADNEPELDELAPIASISLGQERKFSFKHKKDKTLISIFLESGSLLIMHPPTQEFWNHSLPKTKKFNGPRINLTFRVIKTNFKS